MIVHRRKVVVKNYGEKGSFKLYLLGDIHYDDPLHDRKSFLKVIKKIEKDPTALVLFTGDWLTFANTSTQKKMRATLNLSTSDARDSIDRMVMTTIDKIYKDLQPIQDKILGMTEGNHGWLFETGETADQRLATNLGVPLAEGILIVNLVLHYLTKNNVKNRSCTMNIVAHHGAGGGTTSGGDINAIEKRLAYFSNADLICMGHTHGLSCTPGSARFHITNSINPKVKESVPWLVRTGSFVDAFSDTARASYPERRFMRPIVKGYVEFDVWMNVDKENKKESIETKLVGKAVPIGLAAVSENPSNH